MYAARTCGNMESEKKIMDFLQMFKDSMETKMTETRDKIEATNRKIDGRLNGIEDEVKKVNEKIEAADKAGARMDARLSALEMEMKNSATSRRRSLELRNQEEQLKQNSENQSIPAQPPLRFQASGSSAPKNLKVAEVTKDILEQPVGIFRSSWAKNIEKELLLAAEQANLKQVKNKVDKEIDWMEHQETERRLPEEVVPDIWEDRIKKQTKTSKIRKPLKIEKWFGVESESESNEDTDDSDWLEIDRKKRRENKKKLQTKKRKDLEVLTARKASCMVGVGPIDLREVEKDRKDRVPYEKSKIRILKQLLADRLDYDEIELDELDIRETRLNPKGRE